MNERIFCLNKWSLSSQTDLLLVGLQNKEHAKELCASYYPGVQYTAKDIQHLKNKLM
jgi:hypothetical protein